MISIRPGALQYL